MTTEILCKDCTHRKWAWQHLQKCCFARNPTKCYVTGEMKNIPRTFYLNDSGKCPEFKVKDES